MSRKVAISGVLMALAFIFSYIEMLIPLPLGIPGMKLGLANIVIVIGFELSNTLKPSDLLWINLGRVILAGFLFGNLSAILFSLSGALISFVGMYLIKKSNQFSVVSMSAVGGVAHNIGQLLIAYFVVKTYHILVYVPIVLWAGLGTGLLLGFIALFLIPYIEKVLEHGFEKIN